MGRVAQNDEQSAEKAKRRANTAGQIIPRGEGTRLIRIFVGRDGTGKRRYLNKTVKGKKKDAQDYLSKNLTAISTGTFIEPSPLTLSEYLDKWLEVAARPRVSRRTADGYATLLKRYICEPLGHKRLDKLQVLEIQSVYGGMQGRGLSSRVVRHTHSALHNALAQAVKWGMLFRNPASLVELPKVPHKERRVLSPDEAQRFLEAANVKPNSLLFEFALITGMRSEEYLALQWSDIDFERSTVQVRRALVRHKKSWSFEETKTARSRRTVFLPSQLLNKLATHKRAQAERRLKLGAAWQACDLIFCGDEGSRFLSLI
jgi:integrase